MRAIKILLIVVLSIVTLAITTGLVLVLTGKLDLSNFRIGGIVSEKLVLDKEYDEYFKTITMNSDAGDMIIKTSDNEKIRVVVYGEEDKTEVTTINNTLNIKTSAKKCNFICFNNTITKIEVYIPEGYNGNIEVDTKYGDIKADTVANLEADTNYGDIKINKVLEYFELNTNYGDIKIDELIITKDSSANTNYGDIKVGKTNPVNIEADTDLGDTKVNRNYPESNINLKLETNLGDVKVSN